LNYDSKQITLASLEEDLEAVAEQQQHPSNKQQLHSTNGSTNNSQRSSDIIQKNNDLTNTFIRNHHYPA
jgi:hypothetical protein